MLYFIRYFPDGTYASLLATLARVDVLLLDDFALVPLQEPGRRQVVSARSLIAFYL